MAGNSTTTLKIGVDKPEWLPAKYFLAARIGTGLFLGLSAVAYGTAVAVTLENIAYGDGARVGELVTLFVGGWVIKETLKRIVSRKVETETETDAVAEVELAPAAVSSVRLVLR